MGSWVPGAVFLGVGLLWIFVRVTVAQKAETGSWVSHLIREVAVIRDLPIIGWIWRLLPVLLVAGGILWLSGVRPPGSDDAGEKDSPPPAAARETGTLCADPTSRPDEVPAVAWTGYQCRSKADAGERWSLCLRRAQYTQEVRRGCPGTERCCPPE